MSRALVTVIYKEQDLFDLEVPVGIPVELFIKIVEGYAELGNETIKQVLIEEQKLLLNKDQKMTMIRDGAIIELLA